MKKVAIKPASGAEIRKALKVSKAQFSKALKLLSHAKKVRTLKLGHAANA